MPVETVLIIDDSPTERAFLSGILTKGGYKCILAETGEEGVAKAKSSKPDLILLDVIMPGLNGFEAARLLQRDAATNAIPIFICTTKDQATDKVWGLRQGATHTETSTRLLLGSPLVANAEAPELQVRRLRQAA
jgi:twitching motility two-component system response regulator PilH